MSHKSTLNNLDSLLKIMQALRAPDGCPWDVEQTPESLAPFILEEACELIDAIEAGRPELILDELGDLLLQVVFLAQIFKERSLFDFHDVATGIADKLVRRHPHVFDQNYNEKLAVELDQQWDNIKRSEATHTKSCMADHLPKNLPALQRAQKLISKASRVDRQTELPEVDKQQLSQMFLPKEDNGHWQPDEEALGAALFHIVKLGHKANLDAESALRKFTKKIVQHLDQERL